MFTVVITEKGGSQRTLEFDRPEITIGRVQGNDIILPKGNVSKKHSRIVLKDGRFIVVDLKSTNGTYVNGRKITSPLVVKSTDKIYIGDFILTLEDPSGAAGFAGAPEEPPPASEPPPPPQPPLQQTLDRRPPPLRPQAPPGAGLPSIARPTMRGFEAPPSAAPPQLPPRGEAPPPPARPRLTSQPPPPPSERFALDEDPSDESVPPRPRIAERGAPPRIATPLDDEPEELTPVPASSQAYAAQAAYAPPAQPLTAKQPAYAPPPQTAPAPQPAYAPPPQAAPAPQAAYAPPPQTAPAPQPVYAPPPQAAPAPQPGYGSPTAPYTSSTATLQPQAAPAAPVAAPVRVGRPVAGRSISQSALRALVARIAQSFETHVVDPRVLGDEQRGRDAQRAVDGALGALAHDPVLDGVDREALGSAALRELVGLGALDVLLGDASVREIVIEAPGRVLVDAGDGLATSGHVFSSHAALDTLARRVLARVGAALDPARPIAEARVGDAWSAHIVGAPLVAQGALLALTRIDRRPTSATALVERGALTASELERLRSAVAARRSVLVSGPAGVTALLGALTGLVGVDERLVVVEDVAGLAIDHANVTALQAGGAGSKLGLRDVLREAERLRPDRLVIDDIRGAEAYDVLVTMAARRGRVLAGVHASSPDDALRHLELLATLDGRAQSSGAHALVRAAVQVVVQLAATGEGGWRVAAIEDVR
jgi:pilus assembly protein CpaF